MRLFSRLHSPPTFAPPIRALPMIAPAAIALSLASAVAHAATPPLVVAVDATLDADSRALVDASIATIAGSLPPDGELGLVVFGNVVLRVVPLAPLGAGQLDGIDEGLDAPSEAEGSGLPIGLERAIDELDDRRGAHVLLFARARVGGTDAEDSERFGDWYRELLLPDAAERDIAITLVSPDTGADEAVRDDLSAYPDNASLSLGAAVGDADALARTLLARFADGGVEDVAEPTRTAALETDGDPAGTRLADAPPPADPLVRTPDAPVAGTDDPIAPDTSSAAADIPPEVSPSTSPNASPIGVPDPSGDVTTPEATIAAAPDPSDDVAAPEATLTAPRDRAADVPPPDTVATAAPVAASGPSTDLEAPDARPRDGRRLIAYVIGAVSLGLTALLVVLLVRGSRRRSAAPDATTPAAEAPVRSSASYLPLHESPSRSAAVTARWARDATRPSPARAAAAVTQERSPAERDRNGTEAATLPRGGDASADATRPTSRATAGSAAEATDPTRPVAASADATRPSVAATVPRARAGDADRTDGNDGQDHGDATRPGHAKPAGGAARPADAHRPDDATRPSDAHGPDDATRPADAYRPDDATRPGDAHRPDDVTRPSDAHGPDDATRPGGAARPGDANPSVDATRPRDANRPEPGPDATPPRTDPDATRPAGPGSLDKEDDGEAVDDLELLAQLTAERRKGDSLD